MRGYFICYRKNYHKYYSLSITFLISLDKIYRKRRRKLRRRVHCEELHCSPNVQVHPQDEYNRRSRHRSDVRVVSGVNATSDPQKNCVLAAPLHSEHCQIEPPQPQRRYKSLQIVANSAVLQTVGAHRYVVKSRRLTAINLKRLGGTDRRHRKELTSSG